jgi:predicted metal-dependent hydrolase
MSTNSYLQLGSVEVLVVRKKVKNLHLSVLPPSGRVRVTSPESMNDDAIRTLISTRLPWIKKQQTKFTGQERQTPRKYASGESHYFFGKRYRLDVIYKDESPRVFIKGKNKIILQVRPKSSKEKRQEVLSQWYRGELHKVIEELMTKWQKKMSVHASSWSIKQMKTRWGTCNHKRARILLNLELAKKPIPCVEYVVVHELVHLIEKRHSEKFTALMTKFLSKWKSLKEELNKFILSYEVW